MKKIVISFVICLSLLLVFGLFQIVQLLCIGMGIGLAVYGLIYIVNGPMDLPDSVVNKTMYVFWHKGNVAELTEIINLSPHKKNKGEKFYIPDSCGILEPRKTYDFYKNEKGDFCARQPGVMLG